MKSSESDSAGSSAGGADEYDVVVIGGGFAGTTAAREARFRGCSVLLIEARERLGGRTHSERHGDHVVEFGGTWIHWSQPNVWTEAQRYGLELIQTQSSGRQMILSKNGVPQNIPVLEGGPALASGLAKLMEESTIVFPKPYDPGFAADQIAERAHLSLADRIMQIQLTGLEKDLVEAFYTTLGHCDLSEISYADALRVWALAGREYGALSDSLTRFKFKDGTGALIEAIRADGDPDILFGDPVRSVEQDDMRVCVTTASGRRVTSRSVVVAVPLNVISSIQFSPPLVDEKIKHSTERHAGHGLKGYVQIKQNVGEVQGMAPGMAPISSISTDYAGPDGTRLIVFGPAQEQLDMSDIPAVERAIRAFLPGVEVVGVTSHDWVSDPFARGTWCSFRPGQLNYFPASAAREGRVFFANGDTATGWRGYIDGAIERGLKTGLEASRVAEAERKQAAA